MSDEKPGVWCAYMWDYGIHELTIHETEVEALRAALGVGGKVVFVEYGDQVIG